MIGVSDLMRAFSRVLIEPRWQLAILLALVFASLLVMLPSVAKYHGDERFYTDAAIRMTQSGNYVTPYTANGALRFNKPILPYWSVLAGYAAFGISLFGSRIVFLLAGCWVIFLTYRLALDLFNRPPQAALAALIVGTNVQLLTISTRSTPDALLCLFVLLSLLGSARVLLLQDRAWKNYVLMFVGAGCAVQTRGLPGLGVAVFPFLFGFAFRRSGFRLRTLLEWRAVLLGMLVASSWFGVMLWLHGRTALEGFFYDQVTKNVREYEVMDTFRNLQVYAVGVLRHFLPWSALLIVGLLVHRQTAAAFWREHRLKCWFLLGWFLFILVPFMFGGVNRTRYMIVAYPSLAVLLAGLLSQYAANERFERWLSKIVAWAAVVMAAGGLTLAVAGALVHVRVLAAGVLLILAGIAVWQVMRRGIRSAHWLAIAAIPLTAFWATELLLRPAFSRSPAADLTDRLLVDDTARQRAYAVDVPDSIEAQMRLLSGGRLTVVSVSPEFLMQVPPGNDPVFGEEKHKGFLETHVGPVEQVGFAGRRWRGRDFADLLSPSRRASAYARNLVPYYVAYPRAD